MNTIKSINPSNYQIIDEVLISTEEEIKSKVAKAKSAQSTWRDLGIEKRVEILRKALTGFLSKKEEICKLESQEMGMPLQHALLDIDANFSFADWYFDNATKYLSPEITFESDTEVHQVFYEPIGIMALIIPWNFPFANFIWGALQSLICGNVVIMKHSEEVPLFAKFIDEVMSKHLPEGVFSVVYGAGDVGRLLLNQDINMVVFTGSTKTGKYIYGLAGKRFIKAVVELGGSAPGVVFEDADLDLVAESVTFYRLFNQGQMCDGLKRLIVQESIADQLIDKLQLKFESLKIGNPADLVTEVGPLVAKRQLDLLISQVEDSVSKGAKIITGGNSLESTMNGAYYQPTILKNITDNMRVWNEEVFGPVLPIATFKTEEEAINLANQTPYGLGSYLYTKDLKRADKVCSKIESGMVSINGTNFVQPFNPFGGYKNSGIGREHGKFGFHEYVKIKVVSKNK